MKSSSLKMGLDIVMEKGPAPRPVAVKAWPESEKLRNADGNEPFKYMADALLGLSLLRLNPNLQCPAVHKERDSHFCEAAWTHLDPHWELWKRSHSRVKSLHGEVPKVPAKTLSDFEKYFNETLETACTPSGVDLKELCSLIETIDYLESKKSAPLLYNFGLSFSPAFVQKLHSLYSLLFHLRSVVAVDYNAHVDDPAHEAVKVDSITDYLAKADYIVNDALMYWHFMKASKSFTEGRGSDVKVEKMLVEPVRRAFEHYSHNGCHLINCLPKTFLDRLGPADLEEALYLVQMDWLLGSEAGLLFRVREELFGLRNGYEKIFWHDIDGGPVKKPFHLSLVFEINEKELGLRKAA